MSRAQYQKAAERVYWIIAIWSVGFVGATAWFIEVFGGSIGAYGQFIRGHLGELLGGAACGLTLGAQSCLFGWQPPSRLIAVLAFGAHIVTVL